MKKLLALFFAFAALYLVAAPRTASSDVLTVSQSFSFIGAGVTPWLPLPGGQNGCTITYTSVGGGSVSSVQGASDTPSTGGYTPVTIPTFGTSGTITNPSITSTTNPGVSGSIAPYALTAIRLNVTSVSSGNLAGTLTCSGATIPTTTSSGGTVNANVSPLPLPIQGSAGSPVPVYGPGGSPVPTLDQHSPAPYVPNGVNPSGTPTPAAYDVNNNLQTILGPNFQTAPTVTGALNASTVAIPTNGMAAIRYSTLNSTLTGTPYTVQYQVSNDNVNWTTTNCLVLGSSSGSAYHTSQSGLEQGSCDVSRAAYWRATLSAFSGTAAGNLIVNYSFSASPTPCIAAANGVCIALLTAGDTITNTTAALPVIGLNAIYNGASYFTREYGCANTAQINNGTSNTIISAAGTYTIVAAAASQSVHVCAVHMQMTGTSLTVQWSNAATCGTGPTYFTTVETWGTGGTYQIVFGQNSGWLGGSGNALCLVIGGTPTSVAGTVQYAQF